jgi:hypothetical protein
VDRQTVVAEVVAEVAQAMAEMAARPLVEPQVQVGALSVARVLTLRAMAWMEEHQEQGVVAAL